MRTGGPGVGEAGRSALLLWQRATFAYADSYDDAAERYRGLRCGQRVDVLQASGDGLLVKPEGALRQQKADEASTMSRTDASNADGKNGLDEQRSGGYNGSQTRGTGPEANARPKRYHGSVNLDATRAGRDAARIAEEVIAHLAGLLGAKVNVTLDVEATVPDGVPGTVVRTVTENSRTLKFTSHGFEKD